MRALRVISEAPSLNVLKAELCLGNTTPSNDREHVFPAASPTCEAKSRKVVSSDTLRDLASQVGQVAQGCLVRHLLL